MKKTEIMKKKRKKLTKNGNNEEKSGKNEEKTEIIKKKEELMKKKEESNCGMRRGKEVCNEKGRSYVRKSLLEECGSPI